MSETETSADWDVETELQKELDAVSICSHVSSSSSSTGAEENSPEDDADDTSNPLHKLLEDWRIKERKLHSFETMLSGAQLSQYDILDRISDQGQKQWPGPSSDSQDTDEVSCLVDPIFRIGEPALKEITVLQIDSMAFGETSSSLSPFSQQCPKDLPLSNFGISCALESNRQSQKHEITPKISTSHHTSQDFDKAENKSTKSHQEENDFPCCVLDYVDALSMLRKKRMGMLAEFRAAEAERLVGKNLKRQRETEESEKILLLASQRRQEQENEIWNEKRDKIVSLDLEMAKRIELFEELQRTEELDLDIQILYMECRSKSIIDSENIEKLQENEPELRRLEEDKTLALTSDQEDEQEAVQTACDDHCVKCCVLIQSWIRGFICRRNYQLLKYQNSHGLVSLLLPNYATTDVRSNCGQEYPICDLHEDMRISGLSGEPMSDICGQKDQQHGAQTECRSIITVQVGTRVTCQTPEEILTMLTGFAESGSMQEFQSCLVLATSCGLIDEASEVEAQFIQRKENVQSWLEHVVHGWETSKSKIEIQIENARRLEMFPITAVAEAVMSAREKEIHKNLEASILKASRRNYSYWIRKATNFGLEDTIKIFSKSFQRKIKTVRNSLKREAKLGTKEKYVVLFKNAISLGLQLDVHLALKIVLKRVLQVFKRAILLEYASTADDDSKEQDWMRVDIEGTEIGLDSRNLAELRHTLGAGRRFESVQRIWVNTFKANDTGGPLIVCHGNNSPLDVADPKCDASESQLSGNSHQLSLPSGFSLSVVSGAPVTPESKALRSLPQNWPEINVLQRDWQEHTFTLRNLGNNYSNYLQQDGYSTREHDSLPPRFSRDKIHVSTTYPTTKQNLESIDVGDRPAGCLTPLKDSGEAEEVSAELSQSEEDLRRVGEPHLSEVLENQKVTAKKSILTRELLEKKLACTSADLSRVTKLDLTDQHLKSLGRANIFRWCPRMRFLTVDMNKLTTLRGVFQGGEDRLERVSVKDNLLRDMSGLECLGKMSVLNLDGNLLSQLGFPLSSPISANENGKKGCNVHINVKSKNCSSQQSPLHGLPVVEYCWPRLKVLTVGRNRLTKILHIGNLCPNLEVLDVGSNQIFSLGGTEDNSLAGLHHLRVLDVGQNRLQGRSLWKGLENCPELASLVASRNKLRELPTHFGSVLLREIWLNGNAIKRLSSRAWLPSLQRLYLQDNMIDSLESVWGCPALEVLDLSFNSISELSQLRHLSCFPCLRSLQLNDNPVSEQEDHTTCVLQAVPWLAELDNEAVEKASRQQAITKIFKGIMDVVSLEFLKEKISRDEVLLRGFSNPSGAHRCALNKVENSDSNPCQFVHQREVNNVLNGDGDECFLWEVLSEAKHLATSSSIMKSLLTVNADMVKFEGLRNFSEAELEARRSMIAYQQMTSRLKGRLHAATKETCIARTLKEGDQSVPYDPDGEHLKANSYPVVPFINLSTESRLSSDKAGESNLRWCLEKHATFDSYTGREVYIENKEYKLQAQTQIRRVTKLQALVRGYLTRLRIRLLKEQNTSMCQEQEHKCAGKIQAVWRGWKVRRAYLLDVLQGKRFSKAVTIQAHWRGYCVRRRFRQALDMAKYVDDDDFDYVSIDDSQFFAGETALCAFFYQPNESILSELSESVFKKMAENNQALAANDGEGIKSAGWKTDDHTKDATPLALEVEVDASHGMGVAQSTFRADNVSSEEPEHLMSSKDKICSQLVLQDKSTDLELSEDPEKKVENKAESREENKDITDLLGRIGIKSDLNIHVDNSVSKEEVFKIINGHREGVSLLVQDLKDHIITDASTIPATATDVKKKATAEDLAKDWGLKDEKTAQSLLKARQRTERRVKDIAHRSILQDPAQRLKRFREKVQGQGPAPTRHFEKRASLNFSGLSLRMPADEQESHLLPIPELFQRSESNVRTTDGYPGQLPVPRLPYQPRKKSCYTESIENKKDMRKHPTKSVRDLSAIHLSTVVLNTALPLHL
ncbi:unnamed protein product [Calypogeia fissa]